MIKIRLQGTPLEVSEFADALERAGCVLERSNAYKNRGDSRCVRVYLNVEAPRRDGATLAIDGREFR